MNIRLKQIRDFKGLTQKQFSELVGLNLRSLQNYESGERTIPSDVVTKLYMKLRVNPVWFLTGQGEMFGVETAPRTQAIVEMIESLDDSQKQKIYNVIEDAKRLQEMKERIDQLLQLQVKKTA